SKYNASEILAAYSLRKLTPGYSGSAILARNSSASELGIGFTNADLNQDMLIDHAASGDVSVVKFYDQSMNNGNDLEQSVVAQQPLIVESGSVSEAAYGKLGLKFSSSIFSGLESTLALANSDFTLYLVFDASELDGEMTFEIIDSNTSAVVDSLVHELGSKKDKVLLCLYYDQTDSNLMIRLPEWSAGISFDPSTQMLGVKFDGSYDFSVYISELILLAKNLIKEGVDVDSELEIKTYWNLYGKDTVYPLDLVNTLDVIGGFSLRKLKGDFDGEIIGILNDSDVYSEIGLDDDLVNEVAIETHIGTGDAKVTRWINQTGDEDIVFEQSEESMCPYIAESGTVTYTFYDRPGLKFNESDLSWMLNEYELNGSDYSIYVVADIQNGDGNITLKVFNSTNGQILSEQIFDTGDFTRKLLICLYYNNSSQSLTFRIQNNSKVFDFDINQNMFALYTDETCQFEGCISELLIFANDLRKLGKSSQMETNIKTYWDLI
ncbi:MAG TPA: hypothetical protein VGF79_06700, partial [Bacteroidia bacterium]